MELQLQSMSKDELLALKREVDKAISSYEKRQKAEALAAVRRAAEDHGFSLDEILGGKPIGPAPKYRNPANPDQTWTGRGRQPAWFKDAIAGGTDAADMEI